MHFSTVVGHILNLIYGLEFLRFLCTVNDLNESIPYIFASTNHATCSNVFFIHIQVHVHACVELTYTRALSLFEKRNYIS